MNITIKKRKGPIGAEEQKSYGICQATNIQKNVETNIASSMRIYKQIKY